MRGDLSHDNSFHEGNKLISSPLSLSLSRSFFAPFSSVLPVGSQRPQPQRLQLNKPGRVLLVVRARIVLKRRNLVVVERVGALAPDDDDVALVELDSHRPLHELLRRVDRRLQGLALGGEPEAVVNELGVPGHELVLEVGLFVCFLFGLVWWWKRKKEREGKKVSIF